MDAAPPPPAWCEAVDRLSARFGGRDLGTRLADGRVRTPRVRPALDAGARARLAATTVVLVPGGTWPGVVANGAGWLGPWARMLRGLGVGRVAGVRPLAGLDPVTATFAPLVAGAWHRAAVDAAVAKAAGRVWVLGHSYGTVLAFDAARRRPVAGAVGIETHTGHAGFYAPAAPAVPSVVAVENEDGFWPARPAGTALTRVLAPGVSHVDLVLRPPAGVVGAIVEAMGR